MVLDLGFDVGATAEPVLDGDEAVRVVGGDIRDDEANRPGMVGDPVKGEGELVFRDGAPPPRAGVSGDLAGGDLHPVDDRVGAGWPAGRGIAGGGDLSAGHVPRVGPGLLVDGDVGAPKHAVARGGDREVDARGHGGAGGASSPLKNPESARTRGGAQTALGRLASARVSNPAARGRTSWSPNSRSPAKTSPVRAHDASSGRPTFFPS